MAVDKLLEKGDGLMSESENDFLKVVKSSESVLFEEIIKIFKIADISSGKLKTSEKTTQFLLTLENRIRAALDKSGYNEGVRDLLKNFDAIKQNNIALQKGLNGTDIAIKSLNDIQKLEVANTTEKLVGQGISRDLIIPIQEGLYRSVALGASVDDTEQLIRNYIISTDDKDSTLLRYAGQVATDSLHQFDGTIQGAISEELGFDNWIYAGSLVKDSRGQCQHWVKKGIILAEDLEDDINFALDGKKFSDADRACSGMIPGTTTASFSSNRGGYRCRHRCLATNLKKPL